MVEKTERESASVSESEISGAQPPLETTPPKTKQPATSAGGWRAIGVTVKHAFGEMGVLRGTRALSRVNQKDGFDCPSCAWPDPDDHRARAEFCENGAKAVADEATRKRVTQEFFARWSISQLLRQSDHWLGQQGRLTQPMLRRPGSDHYAPISWDETFELIGRELNALDSPDEAVFYTSGRTSNEAAFLYQLFVRQFGTNNLPDCSNMCHESSGYGLKETIGISKGTVTLKDFEQADVILVIGQNPGTNHPRMLSSLQKAVRNGCRIVSVNPLKEVGLARFKHPQELLGLVGRGTSIADVFVRLRVNGDIAFLKGVMKQMLEEDERTDGGVFDHAFIREHCDGYQELVAELQQVDWDVIVEQSGIARDQIRDVARIVAQAERMICCWAMGITQHESGVANVREIVNLLLLGGHMGRPGAGVCPVRGHSNVQGDRTMGIWDSPSDQFLDRLGRTFDFDPPRRHGYSTVDAMRAMHEGRAKVFFALGGNFLSATPDTEYTAKALQRCRLTAHVSTKLNRAHLITGQTALILPCLGRTDLDRQESGEQFVSVENSMGIVHISRGMLRPPSAELLSEPVIVARLARATLGQKTSVDWEGLTASYDLIRDKIASTIAGHERYNERVRNPGGFYLDNPVWSRKFHTATGKARFTTNEIPVHRLRSGEFLMMTVRSHDQFNTTIYGLEDRYRGIRAGRRVVLLNPDDMRDAGFESGAVVDLTSDFGGRRRVGRRFTVVPYEIPRRCAATYFPEANVLVPVESVALGSKTPASKSVVITLERS